MKPLAITLFSYLGVKAGFASLPLVGRPRVIGAGILSGIGFAMSLFTMGLNFNEDKFVVYAKLGLLRCSLASALLGLVFCGRCLIGREALIEKMKLIDDSSRWNKSGRLIEPSVFSLQAGLVLDRK